MAQRNLALEVHLLEGGETYPVEVGADAEILAVADDCLRYVPLAIAVDVDFDPLRISGLSTHRLGLCRIVLVDLPILLAAERGGAARRIADSSEESRVGKEGVSTKNYW